MRRVSDTEEAPVRIVPDPGLLRENLLQRDLIAEKISSGAIALVHMAGVLSHVNLKSASPGAEQSAFIGAVMPRLATQLHEDASTVFITSSFDTAYHVKGKQLPGLICSVRACATTVSAFGAASRRLLTIYSTHHRCAACMHRTMHLFHGGSDVARF